MMRAAFRTALFLAALFFACQALPGAAQAQAPFILPVGTSITLPGGGGAIPIPPGSVQLPSGQIQLPDSSILPIPDGSVIQLPGEISLPLPSGTAIPDIQQLLQIIPAIPGSIIIPVGTTIEVPGAPSIPIPFGSVQLPTGGIQLPDGTALPLPSGSILQIPGGLGIPLISGNVIPNIADVIGNLPAIPGGVVLPIGSVVRLPGGEVLQVPAGAIQLPDGTIQLPDGSQLPLNAGDILEIPGGISIPVLTDGVIPPLSDVLDSIPGVGEIIDIVPGIVEIPGFEDLPGLDDIPGLGGGCGSCACVNAAHEATRDFIKREFQKHQRWFVNDFFENYILVAMMHMAEQLSVVGMDQVFIAGTFFDAKHQLESERLFASKAAEAHRDYHSDTGMCTLGTAARGLAAADRNMEANAIIIAQRSQDRQLGSVDTISSQGRDLDRKNRTGQVKTRFCDEADLNDEMRDDVCTDNATPEQVNRDLDYARVLGNTMSLDVDFSDDVETDDEIALMALSANLFSHQINRRMGGDVVNVNINEDDYFQSRSATAKRSVAENSFYTIAAMKSAGSEVSERTGEYVRVVLEQLGVSGGDALILMGERPSYYALMDVMAQKVYQDPEFFSNLYDKPAGVRRKDVAMQAINLMLDRDSYKSELRAEAMLAVLLELEIEKIHNDTQNRLNWMTGGDREN